MENLAAIDVKTAFKKCNVTNYDDSLVASCLRLCNRYELTVGEFEDDLEAFLCVSGLSSSTLLKFEEELKQNFAKKKFKKEQSAKKNDKKTSVQTPASKRKIDFSTPVAKTPVIIEYDLSTVLTPGSQTDSTIGTTNTFETRQNHGQFVTGYNNDILGKRGDFIPSERKPLGLRTKITTNDDEFDNIKRNYRHMYTSTEERAYAAHKHFMKLQVALCEQNHMSEDDLTPVGIPSQNEVWVCGRICCESNANKLNHTSVMLEGNYDSGGRRIILDLSNVPSYSLFPGQIVLVHGINSTGRRMVAKTILDTVPCPRATTLPNKLLEYHYSNKYQGHEPLEVMIAAGPFTTADNLLYKPLECLLQITGTQKPDVLILIGPFVDINQPLLADGDINLSNGDDNNPADTHSASYEMVFIEAIIRDQLTAYFNNEESNYLLPTHIILIPSLSDGHHEYVFPQPPFGQKDSIETSFFHEKIGEYNLPFSDLHDSKRRVHLMPNPCMFRINEVLFAVTSQDMIYTMSAEEINMNKNDHRPTRLLSHLIAQQSFVPLLPPSQNIPNQVDYRQAPHFTMKRTPDILITPSKLQHMAKEYNGTLFINPGHLSKGVAGGTYAEVTIHPLGEEMLQTAVTQHPNDALTHMIPSRTNVSIKRI